MACTMLTSFCKAKTSVIVSHKRLLFCAFQPTAGSWGGSPERCWGKWVVWREENGILTNAFASENVAVANTIVARILREFSAGKLGKQGASPATVVSLQ